MNNILRCLVLPIPNKKLILPCSTVAEIIPYETPEATKDTPDWLLGLLVWQNQEVPLVRIEAMDSFQPTVEISKKARVAILNSISGKQKYPFLAFLLEGIPKLVRFSRDEIVLSATSLLPQYLMEVLLRDESLLIPNLQWINETIDNLPLIRPVLGLNPHTAPVKE